MLARNEAAMSQAPPKPANGLQQVPYPVRSGPANILISRSRSPTIGHKEDLKMQVRHAGAALALVAAIALGFGTSALAQNIKIGYIDPLSGAFANVGEAGAAQFQAIIDDINAKGGVLGGRKLELVKFDNKTSPQESLIQFNAAMDQGIRYITQGNGSSVAGALIDAVNKWNDRNPDKTVLFLNYAAVDPDFTNDKCSFWHFRF